MRSNEEDLQESTSAQIPKSTFGHDGRGHFLRHNPSRVLPLQGNSVQISRIPRAHQSLNMQLLHMQYERFLPMDRWKLSLGFEHLVVPKDKFTLTTPWDDIKTYTFGTGVAKHYFCGTCGISPFYVPRSNPNGYSV